MRAIDADDLKTAFPVCDNSKSVLIASVRATINHMPTIEPERKKGKWILVKGSNGKDYHKCSECLHTQEITGVKNYCAVCGADMREEVNE